MSGPNVSVIIPTVARPGLLVRCIDGVLRGTYADLEVVVVDQSEDDSSRRAVEERFGGDPRVRYHHSEISGAAHARNVGFALARGELIVFIDDDAVPVAGWLAAYVAAFQELTPRPGLVGGRILLEWDRPRPTWYPRRFLVLLGMHDAGDEIRPFPPGDFPLSGNMALPREVMAQVGGFDTSLGFDVRRRNPLLGGEDSHLGLKVMNAGYAVWYHPEAEVHHFARSAKLTPRYFLRRCYWHGRTTIQLRARADGDRRGWLRTWRDSRSKRAPRRPSSVEPPRLGERAMLAAAYVAFAMGVAAESVALRVPRRRG